MNTTSETTPERVRFILTFGIIAICTVILFALKSLLFFLVDEYLFPKLGVEILLSTSVIGKIFGFILNIFNLIISSSFGVKFLHKLVPESSPSSGQELTLASSSEEEFDMKFNFTGFTGNKFFKQIFHGFALLCMIYVPLDFLGYLIPGILDYSAGQFNVFDNTTENYFLFNSFLSMLGTTIIINFFTALREEFTFRELILLNGEKYINKNAAFLYSAIAFSLGHFGYIFDLDPEYSWGFPIWWGINALIIGFVSAWYFIKYKQIWPLVLAHLLNNTISSIAIRFYALDKSFYLFTLPRLYGVFLVIGLLLYIIKFKAVANTAKEIISHFKNYFKEITNPIDVLMDIGITLALFLLAMLLIIT